ncbi:hypothetical protein STEG23_017659, partial [Scotinomys teguina]
IGNYKRTVKRIDDGHRLCGDLMNCLHERARIEKAYAQQLTEWARRWRQLVEKGPQYGTVEKAWMAVMSEAEKVSELHLEVKASLMNEDFEKIKNWQKEAFHKQMMGGFKETKEAEDGFRKAQKPWAKKLKEVETAKKAHHTACKEEKLAISREANSKADPSLNPEQLKKLQDKIEKCKQDVLKTKDKYEKALKELDQTTPQYMENMEQVFEQCQQFEEKRLRFFREVLLEVQKHLDLSNVASYKTIYRELEQSIKTADAVEDLRWFRANHGPGMAMNWPQFEEWSADLNRTLSRREKKKAADGVTLTGINQTGDQSGQNKHGSNLSVPSNPAQSTQLQSSYNPFDDEDDTGSTVSEKEDIKAKNVSSYEKTQNYPADWSDDESNNPFSSTDANGDSNPFDEDTTSGTEVRVRALYDYEGQEHDELSFKAGDELTKIEDEDEQGWCKGRLDSGQATFSNYPTLTPVKEASAPEFQPSGYWYRTSGQDQDWNFSPVVLNGGAFSLTPGSGSGSRTYLSDFLQLIESSRTKALLITEKMDHTEEAFANVILESLFLSMPWYVLTAVPKITTGKAKPMGRFFPPIAQGYFVFTRVLAGKNVFVLHPHYAPAPLVPDPVSPVDKEKNNPEVQHLFKDTVGPCCKSTREGTSDQWSMALFPTPGSQCVDGPIEMRDGSFWSGDDSAGSYWKKGSSRDT